MVIIGQLRRRSSQKFLQGDCVWCSTGCFNRDMTSQCGEVSAYFPIILKMWGTLPPCHSLWMVSDWGAQSEDVSRLSGPVGLTACRWFDSDTSGWQRYWLQRFEENQDSLSWKLHRSAESSWHAEWDSIRRLGTLWHETSVHQSGSPKIANQEAVDEVGSRKQVREWGANSVTTCSSVFQINRRRWSGRRVDQVQGRRWQWPLQSGDDYTTPTLPSHFAPTSSSCTFSLCTQLPMCPSSWSLWPPSCSLLTGEDARSKGVCTREHHDAHLQRSRRSRAHERHGQRHGRPCTKRSRRSQTRGRCRRSQCGVARRLRQTPQRSGSPSRWRSETGRLRGVMEWLWKQFAKRRSHLCGILRSTAARAFSGYDGWSRRSMVRGDEGFPQLTGHLTCAQWIPLDKEACGTDMTHTMGRYADVCRDPRSRDFVDGSATFPRRGRENSRCA